MAAVDKFTGSDAQRVNPVEHAFAITPDDDADLTAVTRGIWVGVGGDLAVIMQGGEEVTFTGIADGTLLPIRVSRVLETSSADFLVGLY